MLMIRRGDDHDLAAAAGVDLENTLGGQQESAEEFADEQVKLLRASKISRFSTLFLTYVFSDLCTLHCVSFLTNARCSIAFLVLWPMPMYGSGYIFSKPFFTGWVTVGIIWIFCSLAAVGIFPVFEGRHTLAYTFRCIVADLTGKGRKREIQAEPEAVATPGDVTPKEKKESPNEETVVMQ